MESLFAFVQFEYTHGIGPGAGRYVVRSSGTVEGNERGSVSRRNRLAGATMVPAEADVLAISVAPGTPRRPALRRRTKPVGSGDTPDAVPILYATFIRGSDPYDDEAAAQDALRRVIKSEDLQSAWIEEGLAVINRAIRGYRASAHDPYVIEVTRRSSRRVRMGYGTTVEVAEGGWTAAVDIPPIPGPRVGRGERLAPSEVTAHTLDGSGTVLEGEDVLVRAYVDLDNGRERAAAAQVRAALPLLEAELAAAGPEAIDVARLSFPELIERASLIEVGGGDQVALAALEDLIATVERGVERWRFAAPAGTDQLG